MRQFFRATGMAAVARQLSSAAGIVAVLAAILTAVRYHTIASRV